MTPAIAPDYYLNNFLFLIDWVVERYEDLLGDEELQFIAKFRQLERDSQCLLVRLSGRTGPLFRADKLSYPEIDRLEQAADNLIAVNLLNVESLLIADEMSGVLTKAELINVFPDELRACKSERKEYLIRVISDLYPARKTWQEWTGNQYGRLYHLNIQPIIHHLLLLFFGNSHQSLTEFVLQDLGLLRYEEYQIDKQHRVFKSRDEIIHYRQLLTLRDQWEQLVDLTDVEPLIQQLPQPFNNPLLEKRRGRLCNQIAYALERNHQHEAALSLYQQSTVSPARERRIRLLEKSGNDQQAWQLLSELIEHPESEQELQVAMRMAPRLAKRVGHVFTRMKTLPLCEKHLSLPQLMDTSGNSLNVEEITRQHFDTAKSPCFYVENQLLNGMFGLWLWPEMFRGVDGAFSHPFQAAPLDMYQPDFQRNRPEIKLLWQLLDDDKYATHIHDHWRCKNGVANHFVNWQFMQENLLQLALTCIPPDHLKAIFERLLFDLKTNRSGFPDLIQFFPATKSYRMIEVKGPGDRVQDNQQRWLNFFTAREIPAEVCYVSWR